MSFVKTLTIQVGFAGGPGYIRFKLYGFLAAGYPVFVAADLGRPDDPPLSADDARWTSLVDQCTNDIDYLLFGYFFEMKDVTWLECFPGHYINGSSDRFELITFELLELDDSLGRYGQTLAKTRRSPIEIADAEVVMGATWADVRNAEAELLPRFH